MNSTSPGLRTGPKSQIYCAEFKVITIRECPTSPDKLERPEDIVTFFRARIATAPSYEPDKEQLFVICLNTKLRLIGWNLVSLGSVNETVAHPREIFRPVIAAGSTHFLLLHNHPSGDPSPSEADRRFTVRIVEGARLLQITLLDHLIVGTSPTTEDGRYFSFREAGVI